MTKVNPPSKLSENQKKLCMNAITKIYRLPCSQLLEEFPQEQYYPVDIKQIKTKLELNQYSRIEDFKDDMNHLLKNMQKWYEKETQNISQQKILEYLKNEIKKQIDRISKNESEQTLYTLMAKYQKLKELLDNKPRPIKHPKIVLKPPS